MDIEYTQAGAQKQAVPTMRRIEIDHEEHAADNVQRHTENAITSLCVALQWCEEANTSYSLIDAIRAAVLAKYGAAR